MKDKINTRVPIEFKIVDSYDDRFLKVSIKLMHLEENLNGSYFTKEAVEKAIPSLANTPILGFISEDEYGEKDFNGHEMHLEVSDGDYKMVYDGHAYGVIPQDCNPRFELEDEKTYLVVDGLMWKKFSDAVDILEKNGSNAQSMELNEKYDGFFRDDGLFEFTSFYFEGACILGDSRGVQPAMVGASVTPMYSINKVKDEIANKLQEFYSKYSNTQINTNNSKEVATKMTLEELLAKYELTAKQLKEKGINVEEFSIEDLEAKIQEEFKAEEETPEDKPKLNNESETDETNDADEESDGKGDENDSEDENGDAEEEFESSEGESSEGEENGSESNFERFEKTNDKVIIKYALSHDDIRSILWESIFDYVEANNLGERWDFWLQKVYDDYFIIQNEVDGSLYKVDYSKENDTISLGDNVQVFAEYLTVEEKGALELMRNNFESLEKEVESLREFKKNVEKEDHKAQAESLFEQFSLDEADIKDIRDNVHNFTIEEIEDKLYAILGRKNFSIEKPKNKVAILKEGNKESGKPYDHLFSKFGKDK